MKNKLFLRVAVGVLPQIVSWSVQAQNLDTEVDAELDQMYNSATANPQNPSSSAGAIGGINSSAPVSGQPIYILNQATPTSNSTSNAQLQQTQVQKQPLTVIEASPLTDSKAEQLRKARQEAELQTEQKIVEKLEVSRMEDEQRRANVLFGDKFNQISQGSTVVPNFVPTNVQPYAPAPVVVAPVPVVTANEDILPPENTRDIVREEIRAALDTEKASQEVVATESRYFSFLAGIGEYPEVSNVRGNYSLGGAFGNIYDDSIVVEGSFIYSNYTVDQFSAVYPAYYSYSYPTYLRVDQVNVDQYSGALALKYQFLSGMVRPQFGGLAQYSYRKFSWDEYYASTSSYYDGNSATSHAIDLGLIAGVDLQFSKKLSLGLDYRYMFNMSSRVDSNGKFIYSQQFGTPIEQLQYYIISLAARVHF